MSLARTRSSYVVRPALIAATVVLSTAAQGAGPATGAPDPPTSAALTDARGDVWTFSDASSAGYQPAPQPEADVLHARVTHGPYAVRVRLVFDDLQRLDRQYYYCDVHSTGRTANFILEAKEGHWRGWLWQDVEGEWVHVPGTRHHIDYDSDVVTLRLARTLLGTPPWVRVRLRNELGLPDGSTFFTDNPTNAGPRADFTRRLPVRTAS
jgi:hypothetical protein